MQDEWNQERQIQQRPYNGGAPIDWIGFLKSICLFVLLCYMNAIKAEMDIIRHQIGKTNIFTT